MSVKSTVTRTVDPRLGDMGASLPRGAKVGNPGTPTVAAF